MTHRANQMALGTLLIFAVMIGTVHCNYSWGFVNGDMYILGLFEIFDEKDGSCCGVNTDSVMVLEAVRWYIERLNEAEALPFRIGFMGKMTCGMPSRAVHYLQGIDERDDIIGVIGANGNEEAKEVAEILGRTNTVHISLCATAHVLGNRTAFPSFYRIRPADTSQITLIVRIMERLHWKRIAIIYEDKFYENMATGLQKQLRGSSTVTVSKFSHIGKYGSAIALWRRIQTLLEDILTDLPYTEGVVYFGCKNTAKTFFHVLDEHEFHDVYIPMFILPETTGWDGDIFRYLGFDSSVANKRPLIITPPYENITSFSSYWLSLFTNMTQCTTISRNNTWLTDVFALESETHCNPRFQTCEPIKNAAEKFKYQTLYVKYGIIAVHAMVKALKQVHNELCERNCTLSEFKRDFQRSMVQKKMYNLDVDFGSDFNISVKPLTAAKYKVSFKNEADPVYSSSNEVYEIYTFGETSHTVIDRLNMMKVGSLTYNDDLILNVPAIRNRFATKKHMVAALQDPVSNVGDKGDGDFTLTTVLGILNGILALVVIILLILVYKKTKRHKDDGYLTPLSPREEITTLRQSGSPEQIASCVSDNNRQPSRNQQTNTYDELTCSSEQSLSAQLFQIYEHRAAARQINGQQLELTTTSHELHYPINDVQNEAAAAEGPNFGDFQRLCDSI